MIRKLVIGSGMVALVPTVNAATPVKNEPAVPARPPPMKPSDLPIYDTPHAEYAEYIESKRHTVKTSYIRELIHPPVSAVREQFLSVWTHTDSIKHTIQDNYHDFQDKTDWIVKYLREEENKDVRYGAVAMGGVTGFIFGLRGGIIKRIFYAGLGTTAMGMICFPDETKEIAKDNGILVRKYINIAYNFLYGVKPGDPQLEVKFPELSFPKDFSEFVDLTASVVSSVKQAVMPPPAKEAADEKSADKKK